MAAAPILICYDGSEGAKHAIEAAAGLLDGHRPLSWLSVPR